MAAFSSIERPATNAQLSQYVRNDMPLSPPPYPGFFQVAYVTRDIAKAQAQFATTHGVARFLEMRDIRYPTAPGRVAHCHVSLAYVGATEIELIQPIDGDVGIYTEYLPQDGPIVRFHHLCRRFATREAFEDELASIRARNLDIPIRGDVDGIGSYYYCDMRAQVGHFVEGIFFDGLATDWLASIPRF